jgi:very-short-patch-repair endonuclease
MDKKVFPSAEEIRKLYIEDKLSVREIAQNHGVDRGKIRQYMIQHQIPIRTRSEAMFLVHKKRSPRERSNITANATTACIGRVKHDGESEQRARTIFENQTGIYKREKTLFEALRPKLTEQDTLYLQYNIGPYNIDLALPQYRIAIEMQKAYLGKSPSTTPQRLQSITDKGWSIIICYSTRRAKYQYETIATQIAKNRHKIKQMDNGLAILYYDGNFTGAYDHVYPDLPKLKLR